MRDQLRPALGLVAALGALCLSACGSTGTSGAGGHASASSKLAGPPLTRAQFVARAEAICHTLSAHERPLRARQESLKDLPQAEADHAFVSLADQVVALSRQAATKLAALRTSAADTSAVEKLLSSFSAETKDAAAIATAASKEESTPGEQAADALKLTVDRNLAEAEQYGMKDCIGSE
jgi:hypothetical protein